MTVLAGSTASAEDPQLNLGEQTFSRRRVMARCQGAVALRLLLQSHDVLVHRACHRASMDDYGSIPSTGISLWCKTGPMACVRPDHYFLRCEMMVTLPRPTHYSGRRLASVPGCLYTCHRRADLCETPADNRAIVKSGSSNASTPFRPATIVGFTTHELVPPLPT